MRAGEWLKEQIQGAASPFVYISTDGLPPFILESITRLPRPRSPSIIKSGSQLWAAESKAAAGNLSAINIESARSSSAHHLLRRTWYAARAIQSRTISFGRLFLFISPFVIPTTAWFAVSYNLLLLLFDAFYWGRINKSRVIHWSSDDDEGGPMSQKSQTLSHEQQTKRPAPFMDSFYRGLSPTKKRGRLFLVRLQFPCWRPKVTAVQHRELFYVRS